MKISIIVAVAEDGVIGRDNDLPWRLSADLKRFKELTMGHHLLVGRKTWESIGRPLPGRTMIVVSRGTPGLPEGVHLVGSIEDGIELAQNTGDDELFVAGGAAIYEATLPLADRLYFTRVQAAVEGDTFLTGLELGEWHEVSRKQIEADDDNAFATSFIVYERRSSGTGTQGDEGP